ncbi:MAG: hypothetical protein PW792_00230 [Acidobacteriaceae bacterium]|nr:hypothetical protein [Acidobacteriaceae bacterium]
MGTNAWKTLTRPAAVAGMLLGVAAATHAQSALHMAEAPHERTMLAAATTPMAFDELARTTNPFTSRATAVGESSSATTSSLPEDPSAAMSAASNADSDEVDFPWFGRRHKKQQAQIPAVPAPATRANETRRNRPEIGQYTKYIPAGYVTHRQTYHEKVITGAEDLYSPGNVGGWFISAGWSQLINSRPNYGTDTGAFGQRLGAAALRSTTQGVMTDIVFAPLLHQDLRYYVKGPRYNVFDRALYAASRVFIARQDSESTTINTALLAGYLVTAATTQAYYPAQNRGFGNMISGYGTSIGGAMLTNIFNEFESDIKMTLHMKRKTYEPFKDNYPAK